MQRYLLEIKLTHQVHSAYYVPETKHSTYSFDEELQSNRLKHISYRIHDILSLSLSSYPLASFDWTVNLKCEKCIKKIILSKNKENK